MALSPTSSHGGGLPATWAVDPATNALTIDSSASDTTIPVRVIAGSGATVGFDITFDPSQPGIRVRGLDAPGRIDLSVDSTADLATLSAQGLSLSNATVGASMSPDGMSSTGAGVIGYYSADGNFTRLAMLTNKGAVIGVNAAPADADINAGEAFVWFDDTNGASKMMVKAKQADGTVRTGSVVLS